MKLNGRHPGAWKQPLYSVWALMDVNIALRLSQKDFEPRPALSAGRLFLLSERLVFEMADAAAVFGNDVAVSTELVLVGG